MSSLPAAGIELIAQGSRKALLHVADKHDIMR